MRLYSPLITLLSFGIMMTATGLLLNSAPDDGESLNGAWQTTYPDEEGREVTGVLIFADNGFAETHFDRAGKAFFHTLGGLWTAEDSKLSLAIEFHTLDPAEVGKVLKVNFRVDKKGMLTFAGKTWKRIDNGGPGELAGAWLITGREVNGEMTERQSGPRKTMKILSGTRFQWIAYNTETGQFFGTGGGTYTTESGNYFENIEFFSRDYTRVGEILEFEYALKEGKWHHKGFSSSGDPIYEIWTKRKEMPGK